MKTTSRIIGCIVVICLVCTTACRSRPSDQPDLGQVSGTVTMDGTPLAGALVSFAPADGRASQAVTDSEGKYELVYQGKTMGAKVGSHKVYITTYIEDDSDPEAQSIKETIPEKYNKKSTLQEDVKAGKQEIDFPLQSK